MLELETRGAGGREAKSNNPNPDQLVTNQDQLVPLFVCCLFVVRVGRRINKIIHFERKTSL